MKKLGYFFAGIILVPVMIFIEILWVSLVCIAALPDALSDAGRFYLKKLKNSRLA